jgi:hypothetical protein
MQTFVSQLAYIERGKVVKRQVVNKGTYNKEKHHGQSRRN